MRPTINEILSLDPDWDKQTIARLWQLRASRPTRYAKSPRVSQQKRRRAVRRACPHGWTR